MNQYIRLLLVMSLFFSSKGVNSELFVGYDSFCGLPVVEGSDAQQATARTDQFGNKFIHVDPSVMSNWSASRMFVLAHECAHHLLGHTNSLGQLERYYGGTRKQELEADCWAANALAKAGYDFDITRTILDHANQGHFTPGGYPSGSERALNITNCAGSPRCELVEVPEEYVDFQWVAQNMQMPCQHCGCNIYGQCGCQHQFDVTLQQVQVPVRKIRYIQRKICQ